MSSAHSVCFQKWTECLWAAIVGLILAVTNRHVPAGSGHSPAALLAHHLTQNRASAWSDGTWHGQNMVRGDDGFQELELTESSARSMKGLAERGCSIMPSASGHRHCTYTAPAAFMPWWGRKPLAQATPVVSQTGLWLVVAATKRK